MKIKMSAVNSGVEWENLKVHNSKRIRARDHGVKAGYDGPHYLLLTQLLQITLLHPIIAS
jgi:hypothetical protein